MSSNFSAYNTTKHDLSQQQRRNARRIISQLEHDESIPPLTPDLLPDVGELRDVVDMLLESYRDAGPGGVKAARKALSKEYPILPDLCKESKYTPLTLSSLMSLPPQQWLLTNFLYEDAMSVVYGPPGSGKSFVVLDWMCHIAVNRAWLGRTVKQCRVMYLAAEGLRGYQRRIRAWSHYHAELWGVSEQSLLAELEKYLLFVPCAVPLGNTAEVVTFIDDIETALDSYSDGLPVILVIDTLFACAAGLNINSPDGMTLIVDTLNLIRAETQAIHLLLVHHSGKDRERGMSGNLALEGSTDMSYNIEADKDTGLVTVTSKKVKDDEAVTTYLYRVRHEYGTDLRDNSCIIMPGEKPQKAVKLTANQQAILDALPSVYPGLRFSELHKAINEARSKDMAKNTLNDNLKSLVSSGLIIKAETPEGTPLYYRNTAETEGNNE